MTEAKASTATEPSMPDPEHCENQVRRVLQSVTFRNAATLQQLFQFLAAKTIAGSTDVLKEYTIGVEGLGRRQDFDPKIDPIVRVQSHRLRLKLKEYYAVEGRNDPVLIQIPKGHYLPTFETAADSTPKLEQVSAEPRTDVPFARVYNGHANDDGGHEGELPIPAARGFGSRLNWLVSRWMGMAGAAVFLLVIAYWLGDRHARGGTAAANAPTTSELGSVNAPDPVKAFWSVFLGNDSAPVIAYPDAVFLLDDSNDLFRFRRGASDNRGALVDSHLARQFASNPSLVAQAGQLYYENGYTGTGELESVAMLSGLLGRMGIRPTIKSSRDITPDDLKEHNVILLGSPFQNVAVAQLLTAGDFIFKNPDSRHEQWRAQIINTHPRSNEEAAYRTERNETTRVLEGDYSLITIAPGVVPGRYIAILGGLDTKGTEGATMFATSNEGIEELTTARAAAGEKDAKDEIPVFQALVHVRLAKGYQVLGADLTTVHKLHSSGTTTAGNAVAATH